MGSSAIVVFSANHHFLTFNGFVVISLICYVNALDRSKSSLQFWNDKTNEKV